MTIPEIVLQAAETSSGRENIPPRWCKIGTHISEAADGHIPVNVQLASAYNFNGQVYSWLAPYPTGILNALVNSLPDNHVSHLSSPLFDDVPMDVEPSNLAPLQLTNQEEPKKSVLLKRKRVEEEMAGVRGSTPSRAVSVQPLRRSTRQAPKK